MNTPATLLERRTMVSTQLKKRGIKDERVLQAMSAVPRHLFVPQALREKAYGDCPVAIGCGQTISQPFMVALMTELLELKSDDRVLEVGTGSGYQTAILSMLASAIVSIERHEELLERAHRILGQMHRRNVTLQLGDGTVGYPEGAPYDAILVTAGGPVVPPTLCEQLALHGRLVCPVGNKETQELVLVRQEPKGLHEQRGVGCVFVPLIGDEGWKD